MSNSRPKSKVSKTSRPWLVTASSSSVNSKSSASRTSKILYPLLLEAAETVEDTYWKNIIVEGSKGKLPRGYNFENATTIVHHSGARVSRLRIESDPEVIAKDMISFIQASGERSQDDHKQSLVNSENSRKQRCQTKFFQNWSEVPKNQHQNFRRWFVEDMTYKYNLTPEQAKQLESVMGYGFLLKQISSDDIILESGKIKEIICIHYDERRGIWYQDYRPSAVNRTSTTRRTTKPILSFQDGFSKWTQEFMKSSSSTYTKTFHNSVRSANTTVISSH